MRFDIGCPCCGALSRRNVLRASLATAVAAGVGTRTFAQAAAPAAVDRKAVPAIDVHAHYFPRSFLELMASDGGRLNYGAEITEAGFILKSPTGSVAQPKKFIDLDLRLADMDAQGIAVQALSLTAPMIYWADADLSHRLATAWNDAAIAAHRAHPDRFVVLATLPLLAPDRAVDELNRVSRIPGVRGIYVGTNIDNRDLDDPLFAPVLARIAELELPIFLHPLQTVGGRRMQSYYLSNLIGNPVDTAIAACHLIFGGVLDRYPNLKFVSVELGAGWVPYFVWQLDRRFKKFGPMADNKLAHLPSEYMRKQVFFTFEIDPIGPRVTRFFGEDNYMWASDYPHSATTWPKSRAVIADIFSDVPEPIKNKIISYNCDRLFGMNLS